MRFAWIILALLSAILMLLKCICGHPTDWGLMAATISFYNAHLLEKFTKQQ